MARKGGAFMSRNLWGDVLGCTVIHGYLTGKPMSAEAFGELLRAQKS
jgi:hypothetical protein